MIATGSASRASLRCEMRTRRYPGDTATCFGLRYLAPACYNRLTHASWQWPGRWVSVEILFTVVKFFACCVRVKGEILLAESLVPARCRPGESTY